MLASLDPKNNTEDKKIRYIFERSFCRSYRKAKAAGDSGPGKQVLELYNLERDPGERHNLATRRPEVVIRLRDLALNYYRSAATHQQPGSDGCLFFRELVPPRFLGLQTTKHVRPVLIIGRQRQ